MTAPVFEGTTAWVGSEPRPVEIDAPTGQIRWTSELIGAEWYPTIYSAPAVGPDHVYFSFYGTPGRERDGFSVVDRETGSLVYRENGTFRSAIVAGDTVFVVTAQGATGHALTARDPLGGVHWTSGTDLGHGTGAPALGHGVIVVPGRDGGIEALRASDGAHLWTHAVGPSLYDMWPNRRDQRSTSGSAAIADSVVYMGAGDGNLYGIHLGSGAELWRCYLGTPVASSPALSGNMLFVGASDGHLYAFVEAAARSSTARQTRHSRRRPSFFAFHPPTPNPSRSIVRFEWVMPSRARVTIEIYNVKGRRVRELVDEERDAGEHFVIWDGRDGGGGEIAAGVYFARLAADELVAFRKVVHLHRR
jgi:outer membrane protein assembly factor BamB